MIGGLVSAPPAPAKVALPTTAQRAVWVIPDIHTDRNVNAEEHKRLCALDLGSLEAPLLTLQTGDMTDNGVATMDANAAAWLRAMPGTVKQAVVGNHDTQSDHRPGLTAIQAWGFASTLNWTYDAGFALVVGLSPDAHNGGNNAGITLTSALTYLDAVAAGNPTRQIWVMCHAPLEDPDTGAIGDWCAAPVASVKAILQNRPNIKAWISGHWHVDPLVTPQMIRSYDVGNGRLVAQVCAGALAYLLPNDDLNDPVRCYLLAPGQNAVQVWIRDCRARAYSPHPDTGQLVRSVTYS